jgi:hypothetical protein
MASLYVFSHFLSEAYPSRSLYIFWTLDLLCEQQRSVAELLLLRAEQERFPGTEIA